MGTFTVQIQVGDPQSQNFVEVEALVDTGASDTVVPRAFLERLGVPVQDRWPFTMADDRVVEHELGDRVTIAVMDRHAAYARATDQSLRKSFNLLWTQLQDLRDLRVIPVGHCRTYN